MFSMHEDHNRLRLITLKLGHIEFQEVWQFRLDIVVPPGSKVPAVPTDFDFYVKDISYDPITIDTETEKIGGHTFAWPVSTGLVTMTMTMRDNIDMRIHKWFEDVTREIVNPSGTINMIDDYLLKIRRYTVFPDAGQSETNTHEWECFATKLGDVTESRAEPGLLEFPITFLQRTTATWTGK